MIPLIGTIVGGALQPLNVSAGGIYAQPPPATSPVTTSLIALGGLALVGGLLYLAMKD